MKKAASEMDSNMQVAYQEYMLGKKKDDAPLSPTENSHGDVEKSCSSRKKCVYRPNLRAIQGTLEEWKDTNQRFEGVFRSIANLRDRVYFESSYLAPSEVTEKRNICSLQEEKQKQQRSPWKESGFRSSVMHHISGYSLMKEDIRLALNHDLLQHERMLSALRSLLASLAQTVDENGRHLDKWMLQNLIDQSDDISGWRISTKLEEEQNALELAQEVYLLLTSDLYFKQNIASRLFDSFHEVLLWVGDDKNKIKSYLKLDPRAEIKRLYEELAPQSNLTLKLVNKLLIDN